MMGTDEMHHHCNATSDGTETTQTSPKIVSCTYLQTWLMLVKVEESEVCDAIDRNDELWG